MKVSELRKGMLVMPAGDQEYFALHSMLLQGGGKEDIPWLHVRMRSKNHPRWRIDIKKSRTAMYLGTKKDLNIKMKWINRFVFLEGQIFGIDPYAWRRIKPAPVPS
jgi:hypothetical protein